MKSIYKILQRVSPFIYPKYSFTFDNLNFNPILKQFFDANKDCLSFKNKHEHFIFLSKEIIKDNPIDYLEFGVYKGDSIKEWVNLNKSSKSRFYGFDTFNGLPEDSGYNLKKGDLNLGGTIPIIMDPRVKLIKGLFEDTLRPFIDSFIRRNQLIIHIDADLFSSTLYVLFHLDPLFNKGDILALDGFSTPSEEFKAFYYYKCVA